MLQRMIYVIGGMNDIEKLHKLLAAVVARFAQLDGPDQTADRLRALISTLGEDD
jgi:hypothetical protein